MKFVTGLLKRKPNLQIFRAKAGEKIGDFVIIDASNAKNPIVYFIEHKTAEKSAEKGVQLLNVEKFAKENGI